MISNDFEESKQSIAIITKSDLCISCGACVHICPFDNIRMRYETSKHKWEACVQDNETCKRCAGQKNCLAVCPNYEMDYLTISDSSQNRLLGRIIRILNGFSLDPEIRNRSSSGGFVRELCNSLIRRREIDGIISISHHQGLDYFPKIIMDISEMPNSIYHNINFENAFKILKEKQGRFLIIGLPCQLTSITNLLSMRKYAAIKEKIFAKLSLICGYTFDRINAYAFAYYNNFDLKEITYREDGRYRKTRISNEQISKLFDSRNLKTLSQRINHNILTDRVLVQFGCLYCVDHIGYLSDLTVGDAWQERFKDDEIGTNIVIVRTEKGADLVAGMDNFEFNEGNIEEIISSQSELYALGSIGEAMKDFPIKGKFHTPLHRRTIDTGVIIKHKFTLLEKLKIRYIRKLLRKRYFLIVKLFYFLAHFYAIFKQIIHHNPISHKEK